MAGAEESELLKGSASAPGHIIVLCSWTKILHSLYKQEFKSALEEMSGKHDNWYWSKVGVGGGGFGFGWTSSPLRWSGDNPGHNLYNNLCNNL